MRYLDLDRRVSAGFQVEIGLIAVSTENRFVDLRGSLAHLSIFLGKQKQMGLGT